jgi:isopentenyl diphosphate isomerase/L-lactate dehydrogenase-like FMN-dependent dehydrogenase
VLRDVNILDTSVRISLQSKFAKTFKYPIGIAPTAFQRMANDEGEIATVKGTKKARNIHSFTNSK